MEKKEKEKYRPQKKIWEYTDDELIAALKNCEFIEHNRHGPICAEILKRMNTRNELLPYSSTKHRGPIC